MARLAVISELGFTSREDAVRGVDWLAARVDEYDILVVPGGLGSRDVATISLLHLGLATPVVYVPGYLEFAGSRTDALGWLADLLSRTQLSPNPIEVLINRQAVVGGVSFVGTPLWVRPSQVRRGFAKHGRFREEEWRETYEERGALGHAYLRDTVSPYDVVVTHCPPVYDVLPLSMLGTDNASYVSPNAQDLLTDAGPRMWVSSNAAPMVLDSGKTQFVSNPHEAGGITLKTVIV